MGRSPRRGGRSRSAAAAAAAWLLLSLAVGAAAAANGSLAGALRRLRGRSNSRAVCCVAAATGLPAAVCSRRGCTCEARLDLHCTSGGSISAGVPGPSGVHQHRTRGPYEWQRVRHDDVLWHPRSGKLSREGLCFVPRGSSSVGRSDSAARRRGAVLQGSRPARQPPPRTVKQHKRATLCDGGQRRAQEGATNAGCRCRGWARSTAGPGRGNSTQS